jgi:hypothetical protein
MANPKTIGLKLGPEKQVEMSFDDEPIWHRGVRERGRAYRAFAVYRDLGPRRSLIAAYRIVRRGVAANGSVDPASDWTVQETDFRLPACWYQWRSRWQWEERATAYDRWNDQQEVRARDEIRRNRLAQQVELDNTVHYPQILAMNRRVWELIETGLAKTTRVDANTGITQSLDRAKEFELVTKERRALEQAYFDPARPLWDDTAHASKKDGEEARVAPIGRFEWVPDPDVPEPDTAPVAAKPSKTEE